MLNRRAFLSTATAGAAGLVAAATMPDALAAATAAAVRRSTSSSTKCLTLTPTQEVGPFYVAYEHVRSDIRGGQKGVPLSLHVTVIDVSTCEPIHNAALDVWHANALGVYSDEASEHTVGKTYLRGIQLTGTHGRAAFTTIMPGWYQGRTNHIHVKVRLHGSVSDHVYSGGSTTHIGQVFFPPHVNTACAAVSPYTSNHATRTLNSQDRVYTQQNGDESLVSIAGSPAKGYVAKITLGVKR